MFVSDSLVFTELHKTAGSHLGKLLQTYVGGEQIGKHNRIPEALRNRFVLGSIRNPWDWYVSLWGYGCDNQGSVQFQTCRGTDIRYTYAQLPREMGRKHVGLSTFARQYMSDRKKPVQQWQAVYTDANDVDGFRRWVTMMFAPERALDIGEGYGFSAFSKHAGLLSYRFFKLFTDLDQKIYDRHLDTSVSGLESLWDSHSFMNAFVRQERLEEDFLAAMSQAGVELTDNQKQEITQARNNKTNTSSRKAPDFYYDEATANIILQREKFIIDKFGYSIDSVLR